MALALPDLPLLAGVLLAWSLAASPGPANALMAHVAAQRGFLPGWVIGLGAVTGDVGMFLLMWLGAVRVLEERPALRVVLGVVGAGLMLYFAWGSWRSARKPLAPQEATTGRGYVIGLVTVVTSPLNWAWWSSAGTLLFARLSLVAVVGFFAGLVAWTLFWAGITRYGASRVRALVPALAYASAVLLAGFALLILYVAFQDARSLLG